MTGYIIAWLACGTVGACGRAFQAGFAAGGNTPVWQDFACLALGPISGLMGLTQIAASVGARLANRGVQQ